MPNAGTKSQKLKNSKNNSTLPKQNHASKILNHGQANGSKLSGLLGQLTQKFGTIENTQFKSRLKEVLETNQISLEQRERLLADIMKLKEQVDKEQEAQAQPLNGYLAQSEEILGEKKVDEFINGINKGQEIDKEIKELFEKVKLGTVTEEEREALQHKMVMLLGEGFNGILNQKKKEPDVGLTGAPCRCLVHCLESENAALTKENNKIKAQLEDQNKKLTEKNNLLKKQSMLNTASIGIITGLVVGTVLDRAVKLNMLVTIGIAVASALVVGGAAYLVLKPSTKLDETKEAQVQKDVPVSLN